MDRKFKTYQGAFAIIIKIFEAKTSKCVRAYYVDKLILIDYPKLKIPYDYIGIGKL